MWRPRVKAGSPNKDHPQPLPPAPATTPPHSPPEPTTIPPHVELPVTAETPPTAESPPPEPLPEGEKATEPKDHPVADSPASPAPAPQPQPYQPHASPYRILANLAIIFICLFLFIRVVAVEPFGVPTGSMAPALIGNHREGPCPRCGYPVRVGAPSGGGNTDDHYNHVACPNCGKRLSLADARDINGDRLLVDKNVFNIRSPRRWEMAVFHCPDTDPKEYRKPYVKRVVGLPGETLLIDDGEVYADGELLRKDLPELRETRVLVFDMAFVPEPGGWNQRWLVEPPENDPRLPPASGRQPEPADNSVVKGGVLTLNADSPQQSVGATYRHWNLDERKEEVIRAWNSYDGLPRYFGQLPAVHDFSLECEVEVVTAFPDATFACRLLDGADSVNAEVSVGPKASGRIVVGQDSKGPLASVRGASLELGSTHRVEFSFVNRRAILAIDGKTMLPPADLPPATKRGEVRRPLQLGARGCKLVIRNLKLYRDTHYTQFGEHGTQHPAVLGPHEFFMLGDNSGNSQDSRKWPSPAVPEAEFIGKPFLIHQPLRPARVTIWGEERLFQTVDWSRLRWLH